MNCNIITIENPSGILELVTFQGAGRIFVMAILSGSVKSYAQIKFRYLAEIHYGGASTPLGYFSAVRAQRVKGGVSRSSYP